MAVLAEYRDVPGARPGYAVDSFIQGLDAGQSLVERKQRMALNQQRADQQQMEFIAKLPLIQAQATLTTLNADAAVKNATTITNLESKAALESTQANKEYLDAIQYNVATDENYAGGASDGSPEGDAAQTTQAKYDTQATLDARSQKLAALSAKYSYMSNLPEYKGFVSRLNTEATQAHLAAASNLKLEELMNTAQARADASRYGADQSVARENIKAGAKVEAAQGYQASRERIAALNADTKLTVEDKRGKIAAEKQGAQLENLLSHAAEADRAAAEASAAGDEQTAAEHRRVASTYRDAAQRASTFAGQAPLAVPEKSPGVRAKPASPDTSPPAAVSISIPGSDLPPSDAPLANPEPVPTEPATPTQAATVPETAHAAPVKLGKWEQRNALKPGTKYIGPDGILYIKK